jgi:hypothetical protein
MGIIMGIIKKQVRLDLEYAHKHKPNNSCIIHLVEVKQAKADKAYA